MVSARWKSRVWRRKFAREIGSIVLGVLIALGLGAVATQIGWQLEIRRANEALAAELGEAVGQGIMRRKADACIEKKLASFAPILDEAEASGRLPALGDLGRPMLRTWSTDVWDSTRSATIASQMDRKTLDDLSGVYRFIAWIDEATSRERDAWIELFAMVGPGRAIDADEIRALRHALAQARAAHRSIAGASVWLEVSTRKLDLPLDRETVENYGSQSFVEFCAPIAPYRGERYGEAPFRGSVERAQRSAESEE